MRKFRARAKGQKSDTLSGIKSALVTQEDEPPVL